MKCTIYYTLYVEVKLRYNNNNNNSCTRRTGPHIKIYNITSKQCNNNNTIYLLSLYNIILCTGVVRAAEPTTAVTGVHAAIATHPGRVYEGNVRPWATGGKNQRSPTPRRNRHHSRRRRRCRLRRQTDFTPTVRLSARAHNIRCWP